MPIVVGVAFKPAGKIENYDPGALDLKIHDGVIVEAPYGMEFATVQAPNRIVSDNDITLPLLRVLRIATAEDFARREKNQKKQADAYRVCKEKIAHCKLPMKLIEADQSFDGSQVTFHFVAEGRIDFRELVREIASVLHTRVQMHQVGARDHARVVSGVGPCGRPTCCSTFLREFEPVSMKMVKGQNLTLNPSRYSGLCGKLMCCLRYEHDMAEHQTPTLPTAGMVVMTPMGRAKVMDVNPMQEMLTVQLETLAFVEIRVRDVSEVPGCVDHADGGCTECVSSGKLADCDVPTRDRATTGPALTIL